MSSSLPPTHLTRYPQRGSTERADLDVLLDEQLVGTLSTVANGQPWSIPTLHARDGDRLLLHGSTGGGILRWISQGAPVTFTVFSLDGLVVAHSAFDASANYRSAVLRGTVEVLGEEESAAAMDIVTEHLMPGRGAEVRGNTRKELAATIVMALPITPGSWVYKARSGGAGEPSEETDAWAGVVPLRTVAGTPEVEPWISDGRPQPPSVDRLLERYR